MSKTVCDKLRAYLLSQGISGVPDRNTAVFDVLQEHGIAQPTVDGKAIWRATVTSDTGWTQPFTFLRLPLRWFGIPAIGHHHLAGLFASILNP